MKIVLFGGTTEGREVSRQLAQMGADVTVSVVSEYGARQIGDQDGLTVSTGPRTSDEMVDMIEGADLVIDATHPFAREATANIGKACEKAGVRNIRLIRGTEKCADEEKGDPAFNTHEERVFYVDDREEAAELAGEMAKSLEEGAGSDRGNILLTTGVRDLSFYCEKLGTSGIYARVLPSKESIEACLDSGLEPGRIIAMQGPFSAVMNEALIREFGIDVLITKESGKSGGFAEKLQACENCGIKAIVISRPHEDGMTYEEVLTECRKLIREVIK